MTCNLLNNEKYLKKAFERVRDDKFGNNWCIFEYDENSNIVKVGEEGDGGLFSLSQKFNSTKIQYGYVTVKTGGGIKNILINWQGEDVSIIRISQVVSHLDVIKKFLQTIHLTINARNEEDIELSSIYKDLAKTTFNLNNQLDNNNIIIQNKNVDEIQVCQPNLISKTVRTPWIPPIPKPVAAMPVKKTKPKILAVDLEEREKFWKGMRVEEENRRLEEALRKETLQKQFALERQKLEEKLHEDHYAKIEAQKIALVDYIQTSVTSSNTKKTIGNLIANRCNIFEQKLAEIAAEIPKPVTKPKNFKYEVAINKNTAPIINCSLNDQNELLDKIENDIPKLTVTSILNQFQNKLVEPNWSKNNKVDFCNTNRENHYSIPIAPVLPVIKNDEAKELKTLNFNERKGLCVKALWNYQAEDNTELTFDQGDVICEVEMLHEGWWQGRLKNGLVGLFPSNYVELI